ncbi:MAG: hypothetical protein M0Q49_04525 [Porticoccaceae bacterium]|nr:hypothetical protein [Porticoccaceae bacterium]
MADIGPHDLVDIPGMGQFEVVGHVEDYSNSPWPLPPSAFPVRYSVGVHKASSPTRDEYGREVTAYTPPKDQPGTPLPVHGWANPRNTEPKLAGHDRVVVELELFIPEFLVANLRRVEG